MTEFRADPYGRHRSVIDIGALARREDGASALSIDGWSVLTYTLVRSPVALTRALRALAEGPVARTYSGVHWGDDGFSITPLRPLGTLDPAAHRLSAPRPIDVRAHYLWYTDEHLLAVAVWSFAISGRDDIAVRDPITLDPDASGSLETVLGTMRELARPDLLERVAELVRDDLGRFAQKHHLSSEPGVSTVPILDAMAVDIWDLGRSAFAGGSGAFSAPEALPAIPFEISALLSRTTSHVIDDGRWWEQDPQRVRSELSFAYSYLSAGAAFANAHTCLEVSDVSNSTQVAMRDYRGRMSLLGYDSTACQVWNMEVLRGAAIREITRAYASDTDALLDRQMISPAEARRIAERVAADKRTVEELAELPRRLREGRHRVMSDDIAAYRDAESDLEALARRIESHQALARAMRQAEVDNRARRINLILGIFGAGVAAAGLTQIVDLVITWLDGGDTTRPLIWIGLLLLAGGLIAGFWRRIGAPSDGPPPA